MLSPPQRQGARVIDTPGRPRAPAGLSSSWPRRATEDHLAYAPATAAERARTATAPAPPRGPAPDVSARFRGLLAAGRAEEAGALARDLHERSGALLYVYWRAAAAVQAGDTTAALALLRAKLGSEAPPWLHLYHTASLLMDSCPRGAHELLELAVEREPVAMLCYEPLAAARLMLGNAGGAYVLLMALQRMGSMQASALLLAASCAISLGYGLAARNHHREFWRAASAAQREQPAAFTLMAAVLAHQGDRRAAIAAFWRGAAGTPTFLQVETGIQAACLLGDSRLLATCQHWALAQPTTLPTTLDRLIVAQERCGERGAALALAATACQRTPERAEAWRHQARLLAALGHHTAAARALYDELVRRPDDLGLSLLLGQALLCCRGGALGARAAFGKVLQGDPGHVEAAAGWAAATAASLQDGDELGQLRALHQLFPADQALAEQWVIAALVDNRRHPSGRAGLARLLAASSNPGALCARVAKGLAPAPALGGPSAAKATARPPPGKAPMAPPTGHPAPPRAPSAPNKRPGGEQKARQRHIAARQPSPAPLSQPLAALLPPARAPSRRPSPAHLEVPVAGERVRGIERGRAHNGRVVITTEAGEAVWADWGYVAPSRPRRALANLAAGHLWRDASWVTAAVTAALEAPRGPAPGLTPLRLLQALAAAGDCMLCGGAVREAVRGRPVAIDSDLDLATSCEPQMVRMLGGTLVAHWPGPAGGTAGIVSSYCHEFLGLVRFGWVDEAGCHGAIDVASMRAFGANAPRQPVRGASGSVLPLAFGPDLLADARARDFTANALYLHLGGSEEEPDPLLVDPLGCGREDAAAGVLRACSPEMARDNETWGWRYAKMRLLGFQPLPETVALVEQHFCRMLGSQGAESWLSRRRRGGAPTVAEVVEVLAGDGLQAVAGRLRAQEAIASAPPAAGP